MSNRDTHVARAPFGAHWVCRAGGLDSDNKTISTYAVNSYPDYHIIDRIGALVVVDCANAKVEDVIKRLPNK